MSWTYSGDPNASNRDALRFLIGDLDETDGQLEDEELDYLLSRASNDVQRAAVLACDGLAALYARKVDKAVGPLQASFGQLMRHYVRLGDMLRSRYDLNLATPVNAGPDAFEQPAIFSVGMMDNLRAGPQSSP